MTNMSKEVSMPSKLSPHTVLNVELPFDIMRENTYFFPLNSTEEGSFSP